MKPGRVLQKFLIFKAMSYRIYKTLIMSKMLKYNTHYLRREVSSPEW